MNYNLKPLVNVKTLWDDFQSMLDAKIAKAQRDLEQATKMEDVYRAQGRIAALRNLHFLRDEENNK